MHSDRFFQRFAFVLAGVCLFVQSGIAQQRLKIVATTTHISSLVAALNPENIEVSTLIPGGACPGHFDIDPAAAKKIAEADCFISHAWERRFDGVVEKLGSKKLKRLYAQTPGNWMVPDINIRAARELAAVLAGIDRQQSAALRRREAAYISAVEERAAVLHSKAAAVRGAVVICAEHQEALLRWMGLSVAGTYARAEDLNVRSLTAAVKQAKARGAVLVVDNLQSGADAGAGIAADLGIAHVTLTNFPAQGSYLQALDDNVRLVLDAIPASAGGRR